MSLGRAEQATCKGDPTLMFCGVQSREPITGKRFRVTVVSIMPTLEFRRAVMP